MNTIELNKKPQDSFSSGDIFTDGEHVYILSINAENTICVRLSDGKGWNSHVKNSVEHAVRGLEFVGRNLNISIA